MEYSDQLENAVRDTLVSSPALLLNPRAVSISDNYANVQNSSISLAKQAVYTNRARVSANNLNFGGTSTFLVSSTFLMSNFILSATIPILDQSYYYNQNWMYKMIREVQISFANSQIQNLSISGRTLYDYSLITCISREARESLLENGGSYGFSNTVPYYVSGCIPLSCILQNCSSTSFPIDGLVGNITISIILNDVNSVVEACFSQAAQNLPSALSSFDLSFTTIDMIDKNLAVSTILQRSPDLSYILPTKYLSTYVYEVPNYTTGTQSGLQISSFNTGNNVCMILSLFPKSWVTNANDNKYMMSVDFQYLRLSFAGSTIFETKSLEEYKISTLMKYADDLSYDYNFSLSHLAYSGNTTSGDGGNRNVRNIEAQIYCISLGHHMARIIQSTHQENLQNYSGNTLLLEFKSTTSTPMKTYKNVDANTNTGDVIRLYPNQSNFTYPTGTDYQMNVTYVNEALLTANKGVVSLVL